MDSNFPSGHNFCPDCAAKALPTAATAQLIQDGASWDSTSPNSAICLVQPVAACSYLYHIYNTGAGFQDH